MGHAACARQPRLAQGPTTTCESAAGIDAPTVTERLLLEERVRAFVHTSVRQGEAAIVAARAAGCKRRPRIAYRNVSNISQSTSEGDEFVRKYEKREHTRAYAVFEWRNAPKSDSRNYPTPRQRMLVLLNFRLGRNICRVERT